MKKIIFTLFLLISYFFWINTLSAENKITDKDYKKNIILNGDFNIDLNKLKIELEEEYNSKILFEWNIEWENTQNWSVFEKQFSTFWNKEINLSIYKLIWRDKELIINEKINTFVYKKEIIQIFDKKLDDKISNFKQKAKDSWIYINNITLDKNEIEKTNIKSKFLNSLDKKYLVIWGDKDFIFDILSKINTENIEKKVNIVLISSFNIKILQKYLLNFTTNKKWINNAILIDESSQYEIFKQSNDIENLKKEMKKNNYDYVDLDTKSKINNFLFISKFINQLSNQWFSTINIYLILIIPFLLVWVIIFKQIIWLSTTWILIPVILSLLFIKLSFIPTFFLVVIFLIVNLILSKIISKYNLHYSPRVTLITLINIVITIIFVNLFIDYSIIQIDINDIMFIIFFILISEKLVNIIVSKEFNEYKNSLVNTIIFALISYLFFSILLIKTFVLTYPELILLLIPISFVIWKFTGLRASEYFRFREVIKSIEEE